VNHSAMYTERVNRFRRLLTERGIGRALLDGPEVVSYFTGYTPPTAMYQGCVLTHSGGLVLVVRGNNRSKAESQAVCDQVVSYRDWDDPMQVLAEVLAGGSSGPIGKDSTSMIMTSQRERRLRELGVDVDFVDISDDVAEMRAAKSADEIALHRQAASIADEATRVGIASLLAGKTIPESAIEAHNHALRSGADDRRTVVAKPESADPNTPGAPVAMVELVPAVSGYDARSIRSVAIGEISRQQLENARRVVSIQDSQIEAMRPGALASDVDAICRKPMLDERLRTSYEGLTGHGIGFSWAGNTTDTTYSFTPAAGWTLRPGMIFHMYTRARGFVIGDTILVTDAGPARLTGLERTLISEVGD
jgi:Xaa-Pro dipeptidase